MEKEAAVSFFRECLNTKNPEVIEALSNVAKYKSYKKGELFVKKDDPAKMVPFVESGIIGYQYVDDEGHFIIDTIVDQRGTAVFSQFSLFGSENEPTSNNGLFLTDGALWEVQVEDILRLIQQYPIEGLMIVNQVLAGANLTNVIYRRMLYASPEERMKWLIKVHPDWMEKISHVYLASFIGITPVSFSRIKKKLSGEK